jgi:hypothetical protein
MSDNHVDLKKDKRISASADRGNPRTCIFGDAS